MHGSMGDFLFQCSELKDPIWGIMWIACTRCIGAFILKHVSKVVVDICNNNYINISAIMIISLTCSKIKVPDFVLS